MITNFLFGLGILVSLMAVSYKLNVKTGGKNLKWVSYIVLNACYLCFIGWGLYGLYLAYTGAF